MAFYTSSYDTVLLRKKEAKDVYIQVSRNLGHFALDTDTTGLSSLIDENWGSEFGNWWDNPLDYKKGIRQKDLRRFARHIWELKDSDVFLLCFENVLAGEVCHRIWLPDILRKSYGLKIEEYREASK